MRTRSPLARARHIALRLSLESARAVVLLSALAWLANAVALSSQGRGQAASRPTARAIAPVDLTGYWVSVISEDWQWRMITPARGDVASLPLNPEGIRIANQWNPAEEGSCKAYGAAAIMRMPGRVHITWEDDDTLKIETDAGQQTRRLRFDAGVPPAARDAQGHSVARWEITGQGGGAASVAATSGQPPRWATLKVVTTNLRAGWLRRNGIPYSEQAVVTEYFDRFADGTDEWFAVTTIVDDPLYLTQPLVVSSNFRKERDGSKFTPTPCQGS